MTRKEFIRTFAEEYGITYTQSNDICKSVFEYLRKCIIEQEKLQIKGLGVFVHKHIAPRRARHPGTHQIVDVPAHDRLIFRLGRFEDDDLDDDDEEEIEEEEEVIVEEKKPATKKGKKEKGKVKDGEGETEWW